MARRYVRPTAWEPGPDPTRAGNSPGFVRQLVVRRMRSTIRARPVDRVYGGLADRYLSGDKRRSIALRRFLFPTIRKFRIVQLRLQLYANESSAAIPAPVAAINTF